MNSILVTAFNRVLELEKALQAIQQCKGSEKYRLVIIYHEEQKASKDYIDHITIKNAIKIPIIGVGRSGLENMNKNRIFGLDYCFDMLSSEYVIAIEDDIVLGYDALIFSDQIINKYGSDKDFRGVNLGSRMCLDEKKKFSYGLFRYGLFGQGGAITREQWKKIKNLDLLSNHKFAGFDSLVEDYYKSGYVIMPYASRYIDNGWNGTHAPKDPVHEYYEDLRKSFVGDDRFEIKEYEYKELPYLWREDCLKYSKNMNYKFNKRFIIFYIKMILKRVIKIIIHRKNEN